MFSSINGDNGKTFRFKIKKLCCNVTDFTNGFIRRSWQVECRPLLVTRRH